MSLDFARLATSPAFKNRLLTESRRRIARIRRTISEDALTADDANDLAYSALAFGYLRARIDRFSSEKGLTHDWWVEQRRATGSRGTDRSRDFDIILATHPEFRKFDPAITEEEFLDAAKDEFRDLIAAPGTDYHQIETQGRQRREGKSLDVGVLVVDRRGEVADLHDDVRQWIGNTNQTVATMVEDGRFDFMDPEAHLKIEDAVLGQIADDDRHILGPAISRALSVAMEVFGSNGAFWLLEYLYLPKKYTEILRVLGYDEAVLGKKEFERIKRDMSRKLPDVEAYMLEALKYEPAIHERRAFLRYTGEMPAPIPESPAAAASRAVYATERNRVMEKRRAALVARMEQDADVAGLATTVRELPVEAKTLATLADRFLTVENNATNWTLLKRQMMKLLAPQD